ncbi:MFS transporter [Microtetraspora sp. NBRC 13810]|uniref:MFS transporter n=1 Tax=Microtetraspora sp. NBRC 13810 TaxID=3030990 RepID=UPI0024A4851A|nr:MFS transporter [Microtetraspora sp. NBRC 13810]GLW06344.1 MFS transporter [Microtetraspora sp. NBRC 13810]
MSEESGLPRASLLRHLRMDLSPLRDSRDFRLLMGSGVITMLGSFLTLVTLPLQMMQLTGSYVAVGLLSVAEFVPMLVCGLWGGAIADALDRRRIVLFAEVGLAVMAALLAVNALLPSPQVWALYVLGALMAGLDSLQRPSLDALVPRVVRHDQLTAAAALTSFRWNFGAIAGPALAGLIVAAFGPAATYGIDLLTFLVSLALLWRVRTVPPAENSAPASLTSLVEGVRYAVGRPDLMGTYLVDMAAMFFAMATALYAFIATEFGGVETLGLLYSAGAVGALLASVTSGWTRSVHRHGLGVVVAAIAWGVAMGAAAFAPNLWTILLCLALAGGADMISGVFRSTIWNQTIPDEFRGRLAGIELLSYSSGPMLGGARASLFAQFGGLRFSLGAGGLLCVGAVGLLAAFLPALRRYDARTDENALAQAARRKALAADA